MELCLAAVTARLKDREVLRGVDLRVGRGVAGLVGRNGAGKTTLMRAVSGVIVPNGGTIERDGRDVFADRSTMRDHRRTLGWLPQEPSLPPRMSAGEFVAYAAWLKEIPRRDRRSLVEESLARVDMTELSGQWLGRLSGGQRRRAALAAAIVGTPTLLLLDEPTNGLDPIQRERFLGVIRALAADCTVLLATHLLEDVALAADRWFALDSGRIVGSDRVDRASAGDVAMSIDAIRSTISVGSDG